MAGNQRDTELAIRVKDYGTKTFKEVASSVGKITEQLERQVVAAERGEVSVNALRNTLKQLEDANKQLLRQQGALDQYEQLSARLDAAKTKAAAARKEFEALALAQKDAGNATAAQADKLAKLERAANNADGAVAKASQRLDAQRERLSGLGIETADLAAAQQKLVVVNEAIAASLKVATNAYENYDANLERTKAAELALADAQARRQAVERASAQSQDLRFQQALEDAAEQRAAAELALADAIQKKAAADRASTVRQDIAFQAALEQAQFRQIGTDAATAAGKVDVWAAAAQRATPFTSRFAASLEAILNPSKAAIQTLSGLEAEVAKVETQIGDGKGSVHEYTEAFRSLAQVQREILRSASLVDSFKSQADAVKKAEAAFEAARADVQKYAAAIKSAVEPEEALTTKLRQAQSALDATETELAQQIAKLQGLGKELGEAGVRVDQLAAAEKRLAAAANASAAATNKLQAAASGKNGKLGTFLGLKPYELQNLSFQINDIFTQLASGASLTQTLAQQGGQIFQLFPRFFAGLAPIAPALVSIGIAAGVTFAALRQIFDLESSQRQFNAQLALSADGAAVSAEALAETAHELDVYGASLKEVRKELTIFLNAGLDSSRFKEFGEAAQDLADITGKDVPAAAKELADAMTGGMEAIDKLDKEYNILSRTQRQYVKDLADAGKMEEARDEFFRIFRQNAREGAEEIRSDLTVAVRNMTSAWDGFLHNLSNLVPIDEVASALNSLAGTLRYLTDLLPKARSEAQKAADIEVRKNPTIAEQFLDLPLVGGLLTGGMRQQRADRIAKENEAHAAKAKALGDQIRKTFGLTAAAADDAAQRQGKLGDIVLEKLREQMTSTKDLTDAERIRRSGLKALREAESQGVVDPKVLAEARAIGEQYAKNEIAREKATAGRKADRAAESAENRRLALELQLIGDLRQINIRNERNQLVSLEDRLSAVDEQYAKIYDTIKKLKAAGGNTISGKPIPEFEAQVEAGKTLVKQAETQKFYAEQIKALEQQRVARLEAITNQVKAGIIRPEDGFTDAQAVVSDINTQIHEAAKAALAFALSIQGAKPDPGLSLFIEQMRTLIGETGAAANRTNSPLANFSKGLLAEAERNLDDLISARDQFVKQENELVEAGVRSQIDAQINIQKAYADTRSKILDLAVEVQRLGTDMAETGSISALQFDLLKQKLDLVVQGTKYVSAEFTMVRNSLTSTFASGVTEAIDTVSQAIAGAIKGTNDWSDVLDSLGAAALQFFANFLQGIADVLTQLLVLQAIKQLPFFDSLTNGILNVAGLTTAATALAGPAATISAGAVALNSAGPALAAPAAVLAGAATGLNTAGPVLGTAGGIVAGAATALGVSAAALQAAATTLLIANSMSSFAGVAHSGGVVGPGNFTGRSRSVPMALFAGAPRYHEGNTGQLLRHGERAAILEDTEEVLTKDNPRHIWNMGKGRAGAGREVKRPINIHNHWDLNSMMSAILDTPGGQEAIVNFINDRPSLFRTRA